MQMRVIHDRVPLEALFQDDARVAARDLPVLRALVSGSLRWHFRLEWQAGQLLHKPLRRRDALLGALLRIGLFQLQWLRIPDHAAVSATVEAAGALGLHRGQGVVNAVLRGFLRERSRLDAAMQHVPEALYAHPAWMLELLQEEWDERWSDIIDANNQPPPMWLRVNLRRTTRDAYLELLHECGMAARPHEHLPAALLLDAPVAVAGLPGFDRGLVSVQDAAAQLAVSRLALRSGLRVLDACAAPGGKTAHIMEHCADLEELVAVDRDGRRLKTLRQNLARLGLTADVIEADAARPDEWWDGRQFDRILLDAPCSALGVIRRHPDIRLLRSSADLDAVAELQHSLLSGLWPLLKPGGRLVYATCTVLRRENGAQVESFLFATPDAVTAPEQPELQLLPGEANMDGFYYASLNRLQP